MLALCHQLRVPDLDGAPLQVVSDVRKVLRSRGECFLHLLIGRSVRQPLRALGLPAVVADVAPTATTAAPRLWSQLSPNTGSFPLHAASSRARAPQRLACSSGSRST